MQAKALGLTQAIIIDRKCIGATLIRGPKSQPPVLTTLDWLLGANLDEVYICCSADLVQQLKDILKSYPKHEAKKTPIIHVIASKNVQSLSECILELRDHLRGDFIVCECGPPINPNILKSLHNHYRLYDPLMTLILSPRSKDRPGRDIVAVEPLDDSDSLTIMDCPAHKLVFLQPEDTLGEKLRIRNRELALHPSLTVHSKLVDSGIYVFKNQVIEFLDCVKLDEPIVPYLIRKQFVSQGGTRRAVEEEDDEDTTYGSRSTSFVLDYEQELAETLAGFQPTSLVQSDYFRKNRIPYVPSCHALIVKTLAPERTKSSK